MARDGPHAWRMDLSPESQEPAEKEESSGPRPVPISLRPGFHEASSIALRIIAEAPPEWPALAEEGYDPATVESVAAWTRQRVRELAPPALRHLVAEEIGIYITRSRMACLSSVSHQRQTSAQQIAASKKSALRAAAARRDAARSLRGPESL